MAWGGHFIIGSPSHITLISYHLYLTLYILLIHLNPVIVWSYPSHVSRVIYNDAFDSPYWLLGALDISWPTASITGCNGPFFLHHCLSLFTHSIKVEIEPSWSNSQLNLTFILYFVHIWLMHKPSFYTCLYFAC